MARHSTWSKTYLFKSFVETGEEVHSQRLSFPFVQRIPRPTIARQCSCGLQPVAACVHGCAKFSRYTVGPPQRVHSEASSDRIEEFRILSTKDTQMLG